MDIFENICRTCGNECLEPLNIFEDKALVLGTNVLISELISTCLPASLPQLKENDLYPKQICRICVKKLTMTYEFSKNWETANGEFNVALKFEQRRNRSRMSQSLVAVAKEAPEQKQIMLLNTEINDAPIEYTVLTMDADGMPIETEVIDSDIEQMDKNTMVFKLGTNEAVTSGTTSSRGYEILPLFHGTPKSTTSKQSEQEYSCTFCNHRFHTLKAYELHHKFAHRNIKSCENG